MYRKIRRIKMANNKPEISSEEIREMLGEINEEAKVCDGLEDALIGIGESFGIMPIAVYDLDKIIKIYMERDGMSEEDAREFFEYNVLGAFVGGHMPIFVTLYK
jgi:hypothetical protein